MPSPFEAKPWSFDRELGRRGILVLLLVATGLFLIDYFLNRTYGNTLPGHADVLALDISSVWLGVLATGVAWLLSLIDTAWSRRWVWFASIALLTLLFAALMPILAPVFSTLASAVFGTYLFTLVYAVLAGPGQARTRRKP